MQYLLRAFAVVVGLATAGLTGLIVVHYTRPEYVMPVWVPTLAAGFAVVIVGALLWSLRTNHTDVPLYAALTVVVLVLLLEVPHLAVVVVFGALLFNRMRKSGVGYWWTAQTAQFSQPTAKSLAVAVILGVCLSGLTFLGLANPVVTCTENGMRGGETPWLRGSSGSGSASGSPGGSTTGEMTVGGKHIRFSCKEVELTEFHVG